MATAAKQDMPPEGGYRPINFGRNPAKTYFRGGRLLAGFALFNSCTLYYFFNHSLPKIKHHQVERQGAYLATLPLLLAERDRAYLLQLRKNRNEEANLMANVPGWEVGKWKGERIYSTIPEDEFIDPYIQEYYAHAPYLDFFYRNYNSHVQN